LIRDCGKSSQTLFKNVNSHGINTIEQHINSEVKFKPIYEQWILNIVLSYHMVMWVNVMPILGQENTFALTHALGFDNKNRIFLPNVTFGGPGTYLIFGSLLFTWRGLLKFLKLVSKICKLIREHEGFRKEIVIIREFSLHKHEVFA
jgi:hypothetical protein